ncbi:hypothetical protein [Clostridium sp. D53t1_180928_C8]|uniref:hypothetical protein n=1 Tax=Clostridium sp. D53t1_180928_C8 TaxID=2787101 RepID=UPI0018AA6962|nr:hypothetical protein [Clostridium sp. D53t1_180928_C8]
MYRIEVKELGKNKECVLKELKHITYKDLYNLVKPYISEEHLSFSLPNDCTDGREWGYIYSHDIPIGEILITYIEEER